MRKRNNLIAALLAFSLGTGMLVQTPVFAKEAAPDYERVHASYGERAENYIYQVDMAGKLVYVVITTEGKAHTYKIGRAHD